MNWNDSLHEIHMKTFVQPFTQVETHRLLCELLEDRQFSIASALAESKRAQAKVVSAKRTLEDCNGLQEFRLRAEAYVMETEARHLIAQTCLDMARLEVAFIKYLLTKVPHYMPIQWQMVQEYESAYELVWGQLTGVNSPHVLRTLMCHSQRAAIDSTMNDLYSKEEITRSDVSSKLFEELQKINDSFNPNLKLSVHLPTFQNLASVFIEGHLELLAKYSDSLSKAQIESSHKALEQSV